MKRRNRNFSGQLSTEVTERELKNRKIARKAAADGIVLLKNEGTLPISNDAKIFLAGNGAVHPIKGGTGSGDVNEREVVDLLAGLENAGITVTNAEDVRASIEDYNAVRKDFREAALDKLDNVEVGSDMNIFDIIFSIKQRDYKRISISENDVNKADAAIYMISRIAGEGRDRHAEPGDYYLDDNEKKELEELSKYIDKIIVLINAGGQIDVNDIINNASVTAIMNISQGGMEMGNAIADVLTGKVAPSGKLTSTWAHEYKDFPSSENFSHNNGDLENENYTDGIYVGYRYFESFGVDVVYPFGFGLGYTTFELSDEKLRVENGRVFVTVNVKNNGSKFSGREVVQVYAACPQDKTKKEFKKLTGYKKTKLLAPGEEETVEISFASKDIAVFDEGKSAWVVEAGEYGIFAGNSSDNVKLCGALEVKSDTVIEKVKHICSFSEDFEEIERPDEVIDDLTDKWKKDPKAANIIVFEPQPEKKAPEGRKDLDEFAKEVASKLTDDELVALLMGEITKGQDNLKEDELVQTGIYVPGAAGETTNRLEEKYNVPAISLADGPAGLRLQRFYDVDKESGLIYSQGLLSSLEGGLFARKYDHENADTYHMYATAIPIGTCLAQTFDTDLVAEVGEMIGSEMILFGVSWWLAPGMNIHRNPLCGRNFEYYSEDPLVAGTMAAAMTNGVQSVPGVGTTIKHFACNSQEDNRMGVSSNLTERALREIYLRGFEIAIKTSQPMCIMTSYNLINHIHTANSYDLCTIAAREEWGFAGAIMTDWTTTTAGGAKPHVCAIAGNDLIMPGNNIDVEDIRTALRDGSLPREAARGCAERLIRVILQTIGMEDVPPYGKQFGF